MKVFVAGANGRVGKAVVKELVDEGHHVIAGVRKPDEYDGGKSVEPVFLDLHDDRKAIAESIGDADSVIFVAGSRGKDLLQTDLFGAIKTMQAAEDKGVKRFVELSSMHALEPDKWYEEESLKKIMNFNIAKFMTDSWLINDTDLDYTIVQPGPLKEADGSGKVKLGDITDPGNSIENVAKVMAKVIDMDNTFGKVIMMSDGDDDVEDALKNI